MSLFPSRGPPSIFSCGPLGTGNGSSVGAALGSELTAGVGRGGSRSMPVSLQSHLRRTGTPGLYESKPMKEILIASLRAHPERFLAY